MTTVIITTTATPTSSVRFPPVNGLEYLINSDPATIDNNNLPVTPPDLLHVLNPSPEVDIDGYRFTVHGLVDNPLSLAYADLQQFQMVQKTELLICPTAFADNETLGGIPLTAMMSATGIKSGASELVFYSLDNLHESLELSDNRIADMLLALTVDGQPLSRQHGYPLRLVRPGQFGVFWLKCINDIEVN